MSALAVSHILDNSVDLLDPLALEPGLRGGTDPVRWTQDPDGPLNGIFLEPPADWQPADPPYEADPDNPGGLRYRTPGPLLVRKKSLADHVDDVDTICETLESLDAEDLDEESRADLGARLMNAIAGTKSKVDSTCKVLASYDASEAAMKAEEDRVALRRKRFISRRQRLESYILRVMAEKDLPKMEGFLSTLTAKKNPPKVTILDQSLIPGEYLRQPEPPPPPAAVPDNTLIKNALKSNIAVPGCRLDQGRRLERS